MMTVAHVEREREMPPRGSDPSEPLAALRSYVALLEEGMPCDEERALLFSLGDWMAYFSTESSPSNLSIAFAGWIFLLGVLPSNGNRPVWEFPPLSEVHHFDGVFPRCGCRADVPAAPGPYWVINAAFRVVVSSHLDNLGVSARSRDNACAYLDLQAGGPRCDGLTGMTDATIRSITPQWVLVFIDHGGWAMIPRSRLRNPVLAARVTLPAL